MGAHPFVYRTSLIGHRFVGTCISCGKSDISIFELKDECSNPRNMTPEQAKAEAIKKGPKK